MARLESIADGLHLAEGPKVDFYGFPYPTRMLVAELEAGLWLWSPIELDEELRAAVDALGEVAFLVSPNKIHHLFLDGWARAYPKAELCGLEQVVNKRDELDFDVVLGDAPPPGWAGEIDQVVFHGSVVMDEIVFFHRRSRTAIFADLIENFEADYLEHNWKRWQVPLARLSGITAPDGMAPVDFRTSFLRRGRARAALDEVLSWDIEAVVMAHGRRVDGEGKAFVERAFRWLRR